MFCQDPGSGNPSYFCAGVSKQNWIRSDHPDPVTHFFRFPNLDNYCSTKPLTGHGDGKKKRWGGGRNNILHSSFALHLHITTSDWTISDDCANVVYDQWLKTNFKLKIMFLFDNDSFSGMIWTSFKVLLHVCSWNPTFCWGQNNPFFFLQNYPILTKRFWKTQIEDLIQIKKRLDFVI